MIRFLKWGLAATTGAILVGGLLFGSDLVSYARCGYSNVQQEVRAAIPIDVELERARQMIDKITPELRSNVRLIVNEEIAVKTLQNDIAKVAENVAGHRHQVALLRTKLGDTQMVSLEVGTRKLPREKVVEKLSSRLNRFKQAQAELASKQQMLEVREHSLEAAQELFEKSRARKAELEQQVEALVAKHRLIKAQSVASSVNVDNTQLSRANRLMEDISRRLETAERLISYEADLDTPHFDDIISEVDLLQDVDACLGNCDERVAAESHDFEA